MVWELKIKFQGSQIINSKTLDNFKENKTLK